MSVLIRVADTNEQAEAPVHPRLPARLHFLSVFRACCWIMQPVSNSAAKAHCRRPLCEAKLRMCHVKRRNVGWKDCNGKGGGGGVEGRLKESRRSE